MDNTEFPVKLTQREYQHFRSYVFEICGHYVRTINDCYKTNGSYPAELTKIVEVFRQQEQYFDKVSLDQDPVNILVFPDILPMFIKRLEERILFEEDKSARYAQAGDSLDLRHCGMYSLQLAAEFRSVLEKINECLRLNK